MSFEWWKNEICTWFVIFLRYFLCLWYLFFKSYIATSCCRYYECVNSELREFVCPYPKLFSTETKQCESYQVVKCGIRDSCKFPCDFDDSPLCAFTPKCSEKIDGHYIDEYRPGCKYYYLCKDERTYNYTTCDYGYRFNERIKRCDLATNVKCGSISIKSFTNFTLILFSFSFIFSISKN